MPARDIIHELPTSADWQTLFMLKRKWQVSLAALLMRARVLGRMSHNQYLTAIKTASARGWRRVEPVPLGRPEQPTALTSLLQRSATRATTAQMPSAVVDALAKATAT
jgi:Zn-dependent peptidase ImmA (M78 family)